MKQILLMIGLVALVGCGKSGPANIGDPIVEKAIRQSLQMASNFAGGGRELTGADLAEVTGLYLNSTLFTDAGLKDIAKLQNLTDLTLRNTKITDEGAAELRKALPKCVIYHSYKKD